MVEPRRLNRVAEITRATANARSRARAVRSVSFLVGCTERIATIPAENEKSNLRVCAQRIARMAVAEIFIVLMIMDFIEKL